MDEKEQKYTVKEVEELCKRIYRVYRGIHSEIDKEDKKYSEAINDLNSAYMFGVQKGLSTSKALLNVVFNQELGLDFIDVCKWISDTEEVENLEVENE